ncbi:MAG: choice-of-anchor V domain-containing protein [bacterium]
MKNRVVILYIGFCLLTASVGFSYSNGPPDGYAGDPPNRSTCVSCHNSFPLNSGQGRLEILDLPERFRAGERYRFAVRLSDPNARRWGFELTALDQENRRAGTIAVVDQNVTQLSQANQRQYLKHTSNGTFRGQENSAQWAFDWTAPEGDNPGTVTFYVAGNAANNNGNNSGDRIYAVSINLEPQGPPALDRFPVMISSGWNLISSPIAPDNPSLSVIFSPLIQNRQLVIVIDGQGRIFDPMRNINQIGDWAPLQSYQVKSRETVRLEFIGEYLAPDTPITINPGWNWIAYPRTDTLHPRVLLDNLDPRAPLSVIRQGDGRFAAPALHIDQLTWIFPGTGIMVLWEGDESSPFVWPESRRVDEEPPSLQPTRHFPFLMSTGVPMSIVVLGLENWEVGDGDELAVVTEDGTVWGSVLLEPQRLGWGLTAWGDDPTTEEDDGLRTDEDFFLRLWSAQQEQEIPLIPLDGEDLRFEPYGFQVLSLRALNIPTETAPMPQSFSVEGVFPNPFNSYAEVRVRVSGSGDLIWKLYNLKGVNLREGHLSANSAGVYRLTVSGYDLPAGVYLISVTQHNLTQVVKASLVK